MLRIFLFVLLFLPLTVTADNFTWTLPASQIGGAALPLSAITKSTVKCGVVKGGPYTLTKDATGSAASAPAEFSYTVDGYHYCIVTTTSNTCTTGVVCESDPSVELSFFTKAGTVILNPTAPAVPGNLQLIKGN